MGEKFGEWDDQSVIYRADDPEQTIRWRPVVITWAAAFLLVPVVLALLWAAVGPLVTYIVALTVPVVSLVAYVVWRRRRNRRLTGSPAAWPGSRVPRA